MARLGPNVMVGVVALCLVGGMVAASFTAGHEDDLRARLARFVTAELGSAPRPRLGPHLVLHGSAHEGDAAVFYTAAAALWHTRAVAMGGQWLRPDQGPRTREIAAEVVAPILGVLQLAATATHCTPGSLPRRGIELRALWQFAGHDAAARGDDVGLVAAWLHEQTLGLDFGWPPDERSTTVWSAERLAALSPAAAAALAVGLARLDERLVAMAPVAAEQLAWWGRHALQSTQREAPLRARLATWHAGFDAHRPQLRGLLRLVEALPVLQPAAAAWPARLQQWEHFAANAQGLAGRSVTDVAVEMRDAEQRHRRASTQVRLLRLALAFSRRAPLPELDDPLGDGRFTAAIEGDVATFRSAAKPQVLARQAVRR